MQHQIYRDLVHRGLFKKLICELVFLARNPLLPDSSALLVPILVGALRWVPSQRPTCALRSKDKQPCVPASYQILFFQRSRACFPTHSPGVLMGQQWGSNELHSPQVLRMVSEYWW